MSAASPDPTVSQLLSETIGAAMDRDARIVLLGEDIGVMGGVFNVTRGLQARFGPWRVRDTPISEAGFVGMGVGLAMAGYRPMVEIMFADFVGVCLEPILNSMSKIPYMSGGRVRMPMVVKTAGGSIGSAAQHSQCLWGLFAHLPGLVIAVPSCPADYQGLMASALCSPDPVIFIEHKSQLNRRASQFERPVVATTGAAVQFGRASVARAGSDVTVVAISAAVEWALVAARVASATGIDAEVIDLRTLVPMDMTTVLASVARTGRLLVVDEDFQSFGMSGEVIARVVEGLGPQALRAVARCCMPDVPLPASKPLEEALMPGPEAILRALTKMIRPEMAVRE
jgi:pyruvate dehydrogenase E1 component beta subunit